MNDQSRSTRPTRTARPRPRRGEGQWALGYREPLNANDDVPRCGIVNADRDFDADGRIDLFLTGLGDSRLLHNQGDKFQDVTEDAGLADAEAIAERLSAALPEGEPAPPLPDVKQP